MKATCMCRSRFGLLSWTQKLVWRGGGSDTVLRHGIAEARTAFIEKPILPDALARKVRETLG